MNDHADVDKLSGVPQLRRCLVQCIDYMCARARQEGRLFVGEHEDRHSREVLVLQQAAEFALRDGHAAPVCAVDHLFVQQITVNAQVHTKSCSLDKELSRCTRKAGRRISIQYITRQNR